MSVIKATQIAKRYQQGDGWVTALDGVDLSVSEGEFVAICGHSGSGKSTMLNILGLLEQPDSGELSLLGESVAHHDSKQKERLRLEALGFIFQSFNLNPVLTALENVSIPLLMSSMSSRQRKEKAEEMLQAVGLGERISHKPGQLSGGQQQRVAVARALVTEPALILADEPSANLDSDSTQQLVSVLKQINRKSKTTVLFSTHDERLLAHVDRRIHLNDGRLHA